MSESSERLNTTAGRFIILLAIIIALGSGWTWWNKVYQGSNRVFWGMISNNLSTAGVTKHDSQTVGGQTTDQYTQLVFSAEGAIHGLITVQQKGTTVKSETIGTVKTDYSRYLQINTSQKNSKGKPIDTSKILGVWGKSDQNTPVQYFQQGVLGVVMYGQFNSQERSDLLQQIHNSNVYKITSSDSSQLNGRPVFVYEVSVNTQGLVHCLRQYAQDIGLGDIGLDDSQYAGSPPLQAEFAVDKISRQLLKIHYVSSGLNETLSSQGLDQAIEIPSKTVPVGELQARVQQSLQ